MINWKELEKFISPGKVCTLVIMVDGKEIGAFSFNIETLAYKESLEVPKPAAPVVVAEKPKETPKSSGKRSTVKSQTVQPVKPEPESLDEEEVKEDDEEEVEEVKPTESELLQRRFDVTPKQAENIITSTPMTRANIMEEQTKIQGPVVNPVKVEEKKAEAQSLFNSEEW